METHQTTRMLRGTDLRYTLTRLLQLCGPSTLRELHAALSGWGFAAEGRPSKTLSDALRWEIGRDRVRRIGRGSYRAGAMPRSTEHRIIHRVRALRAGALSLQGGQRWSSPAGEYPARDS